MNDFKKQFGKRVKLYRNLLKYSQETLSEKIGISSHTLSYIERGKNILSFTKLPALCNALEVEPYQLFIETELNSDTERKAAVISLLDKATDKQLGIIYNIVANIINL